MKKYSILLVDDDITIVKLLSDILEDEGYRILTAYNGKQAIESVRINEPDLIVLDWNMPELDGIETLRVLVAEKLITNTPVIMFTGAMTDSVNLKLALQEGAFDFIEKSFDKTELFARIKNALKFAQLQKDIIQLKQQEIVESTIKITRHNQFISSQINLLQNIIKDIPQDSALYDKLQQLLKNFEANQSINYWDQFNEHFLQLHPEFYKNLSQQHNNLSPSELKLCALIKLNFNIKEIADIMHFSPDTVKTARARLRKKLNLDTEDNLTNYLMRF